MWQYDPQAKLKKSIAWQMRQQIKDFKDPAHCAYHATLEFNFLPPNSASVASKNLMLWNVLPCITKKDWDNISKLFCDAGNGILWPDDHLITFGSGRKQWSNNPCTIINIETIKEIKMAVEHEKVFKLFSPQDVETLAADAERIFMSIPPNQIGNPELFESQMAAAAELLIDFANEWADKLKKIKGK
jgi:Holliday junction resolvase RusA-like endonuclease